MNQIIDGYVLHWVNLGGNIDAALPGRCVFSSAASEQQAMIANRPRRYVFGEGLDTANRIYALDALYALERSRTGEAAPSWVVDLTTSEDEVVRQYSMRLVSAASFNR